MEDYSFESCDLEQEDGENFFTKLYCAAISKEVQEELEYIADDSLYSIL